MVILRFDKDLPEFPYIQCRFWNHDVDPEKYNFKSRKEWEKDCIAKGYHVGLEVEDEIAYIENYYKELTDKYNNMIKCHSK
jgi:hypothetical protein